MSVGLPRVGGGKKRRGVNAQLRCNRENSDAGNGSPGVAAWSGRCHDRAYFLPRTELRATGYLIQRPSLQQLGYLPVFLHPLLERHVPGVRTLSHFDQVICKNNQHPVSIPIPIKQSSVLFEANVVSERTDSSPPYSSTSVASRSLFRWSRPSVCIFSRTIRRSLQSDQNRRRSLTHVRVNGLSKVLNVLHQIDGPVGQFLCNLPMREHAHEQEDEFVFAWEHENRFIPSLSEHHTRKHLPCIYASSSDGPSSES